MKKIIIFSTIINISLYACTDSTNDTGFCGDAIQIKESINYTDTVLEYTIENIVLNNNCLEMTILAGGCDADLWKAELVTNSIYLESLPPQKLLKLELDNNQNCFAIKSKTFVFDISPIQSDNYNVLILNIAGWNKQIEYRY